MTPEAARVRRTYILLTLLSTLASSFIWGINTLFLLDAGLNNAQAFSANAFYAAGSFLFEIPTGVIADMRGRRTSYLLGAATLLVATLLYLWMWQNQAPLWGWAIASMLLGLGFTFFTGATDAWLVDALNATGFTGPLESVFARAQTVSGVAMLVGTVAGGFLAQVTNLGVPYIVRAAILGLTFLVAFRLMKDIGFVPRKRVSLGWQVRSVIKGSIDNGWRNPATRWLMLSSPFMSGIGFYAFYAMQPYLLELYGDSTAFGVAGLAAAFFSGGQIVGSLIVD
ncbi:MAG: MFS transporter, partial [Acidimicrobiia bacterium]